VDIPAAKPAYIDTLSRARPIETFYLLYLRQRSDRGEIAEEYRARNRDTRELVFTSVTLRVANDYHMKIRATQPRLTRAIMSTIAVTIAQAGGLDISVHKRRVHRSLLIGQQDEVFVTLLQRK
jgi:hypothetical protein